MIIVIDNYDSFTYNLVQILECLGRDVQVFRNNSLEPEKMEALEPFALVVSPGPGTPAKAGISVEAIRYFGPKIPVLGVCLGHQSIAAAFGGKVIRANRIMHGKVSPVFHDSKTIYRGISNPFEATRYHSLIIDKGSLPNCLEISAWTDKGEIMGLRHRKYKVEGVQFHPESILTDVGSHIIENFIYLYNP